MTAGAGAPLKRFSNWRRGSYDPRVAFSPRKRHLARPPNLHRNWRTALFTDRINRSVFMSVSQCAGSPTFKTSRLAFFARRIGISRFLSASYQQIHSQKHPHPLETTPSGVMTRIKLCIINKLQFHPSYQIVNRPAVFWPVFWRFLTPNRRETVVRALQALAARVESRCGAVV